MVTVIKENMMEINKNSSLSCVISQKKCNEQNKVDYFKHSGHSLI